MNQPDSPCISSAQVLNFNPTSSPLVLKDQILWVFYWNRFSARSYTHWNWDLSLPYSLWSREQSQWLYQRSLYSFLFMCPYL